MPRNLAVVVFLSILAVTNAGKNDTLEMELESNITVVKLEHGLKFQAHSEFGLPDNMTDLFNSTADDSEGSNNSSLPVSLENAHSRARRSNKDGETAAIAKKETTPAKTTKKVTSTTKKVVKKTTTKKKKVTTKKPKTTTKKPKTTTKKVVQKATTKKKGTTKKRTTKRQTTKKLTTPTPQRPQTQHWIPNTRAPPGFPPPPEEQKQETRRVQWPQEPPTTTRRVFVMYEDDDLTKKNQKNNTKDDIKKDRDFDFDWRSD